MTRATGRSRVEVVLLDAAWVKALPGVERLVRKAARAALGVRVRSLTVALSDDRRVQALNKRDRKKDKPTNVLSYPSGEKTFLGDIVLARQTVLREARAQKKSPADHLAHLVVHGTLHLLGHDHETSDTDADRMEALERRILRKLGISDPYLEV
ncbi:rRNA maturation RNase YbeY [Reyranella sp.]|uniref:rRNA maturation RNase YbeY n=1 Tax=Reyranella sp. TaxID=1929291 RepID=UPI003D0DDACE